MYTNADMTLYSKKYDATARKDTWERHEINRVFWDSSEGANIIKSGMSTASSVTVFIPLANINIEPKTGDYIVKGIVLDEVTKITDLTKKYSDAYAITSVDLKDFGSKSMQHYEIYGK